MQRRISARFAEVVGAVAATGPAAPMRWSAADAAYRYWAAQPVAVRLAALADGADALERAAGRAGRAAGPRDRARCWPTAAASWASR